MHCPACLDQTLKQKTLKNGLVVDGCTECRGVWLDRGELLRLTTRRKEAQETIDQLAWDSVQVDRNCPRCDVSMQQGRILNSDVELDYCSQCEGLWFDAAELKKTVNLLVACPSVPAMDQSVSRGTFRQKARAEAPSRGIFASWIDAVARLCDRRYSFLDSAVPLASAIELQTGHATVLGRVSLRGQQLVSPLSKTPCACFRLVSKQKYEVWVTHRHGYRHKRTSHSQQTKIDTLNDEWRYATFELRARDGTLLAQVDPISAEIQVNPQTQVDREIGDRNDILIDQEDVYVMDGDFLYVTGDFSRSRDGVPIFSSRTTTLLISDRRPQDTLSDKRRKVTMVLVACSASVVFVLLAYFVSLSF